MTNYGELAKTVKEYPPERAAQICGIDADMIREVARLWGEAGAAVVFWGMGISQHTTGTDNARCLIALCSITGQVGRPGTGLHPLRGQNNVQGASDAGLIPMLYPDYQPVDSAGGARALRGGLGPRRSTPTGPDRHRDHRFGAAQGGVRGMYMMGENPFLSDPNINKVRKALSALEFLVVQDIFLTETAEFADVVLPASSYMEKDGTYTNTDRRVQIGRKALDPPGRGAPGLADHPGHLQPHRAGDGLRRRPSEIFDELGRADAATRGWPTTTSGRPASFIPNPDPEHSDGTVVLFDERFGTEDGKAHLVPARVAAGERAARRGVPVRAQHRPAARALAHRAR